MKASSCAVSGAEARAVPSADWRKALANGPSQALAVKPRTSRTTTQNVDSVEVRRSSSDSGAAAGATKGVARKARRAIPRAMYRVVMLKIKDRVCARRRTASRAGTGTRLDGRNSPQVRSPTLRLDESGSRTGWPGPSYREWVQL